MWTGLKTRRVTVEVFDPASTREFLRFSNDLSLSLSYITTDGQSASLSWNKAPMWGLRPDFYYCLTITVFLYGAPSLTIGRVCLLQCTMYTIQYILLSPSSDLICSVPYIAFRYLLLILCIIGNGLFNI
jgi:hypothetical protein